MASMNNWLGFSLSPQELPSQQQPPPQDHSQSSSVSRLGFNSDHEISGTDVSGGECFDHLTSETTTVPSHHLSLPAPFGILEEAFNRNNHLQDWMNMNTDSDYGRTTTSNFSMLMGSSCSSSSSSSHQINLENQLGGPKLENFLGVHSFADHRQKLSGCNTSTIISSAYDSPGEHYMYPNCTSMQLLPSEAAGGGGGGSSNTTTTTTIGLSMIKNWLRNQPTPPAQSEINKINDSGGGIWGSNGGGGGGLTSAQSTLSLSMSTDSQTSSPLPLLMASGGGGGELPTSSDNKQQKRPTLDAQTGTIEAAVPRKNIETFGQRTSIYRGVTRHRWTGRYEAHLWDNSCRREGQTRKGRQVYLGGYDKEEKAARSYDLAALKYWGTTTTTNFPISNYEKEIEEMKHMTRQEYIASLRRKSSGFSRGASIYRGVTRHHQHGRWQARIGRVAGNKDLYLGTFSTQEEAAEAYDIAAIKFRGLNAVTNFEMTRYDVKSILESSTLPIGGAAKRLKDAAEQSEMTMHMQRTDDENICSHLTNGISNYGHHGWPTTVAFQQAQPPFSLHYPYSHQRVWCKQEQGADATHAFQDLNQLQLGNTHNFFQPSVMHNLMNLDSSSMEHSSDGSNSVAYSSGIGGDGNGGSGGGGGNGGFHQAGVGYGGGFAMPMVTVIAQEGNNSQGNGFGDNHEIRALDHYENMFGPSDPYHARNLYYLSQQSSAGAAKTCLYDHEGSTWVPTAVPTLAPKANNMAVCRGAQTFTVWNDT